MYVLIILRPDKITNLLLSILTCFAKTIYILRGFMTLYYCFSFLNIVYLIQKYTQSIFLFLGFATIKWLRFRFFFHFKRFN